MSRFILRVAVVAGACLTTASTFAQVPVYLPPAPPAIPTGPSSTTSSMVVDPAPVYSPPVPNLSLAQPSSGSGSAQSPVAPPMPIYRPTSPTSGGGSNYSGAQDSAVQPSYTPGPSPGYSQSSVGSSMMPQSGPGYSPMPGYSGATGSAPAYAQPTPPSDGTMPFGCYDRQDFAPGPQVPPGPTTRRFPTWSMPLCLPGHHGKCGGAACNPAGGCDPCAVGCGGCCDNISVFSVIDAFKGPLDLDGLNGNFGKRFGFNAAIPIVPCCGLGVQVAGSAAWYDWKGTPYTGDGDRFQNFWTAAVFHRSCTTGLGFGIAYDWLNDDYFDEFNFGQFRVGGSWQCSECNEFGFCAMLPDRSDSATITGVSNEFSPLLQGNVYWRRIWNCGAWSTISAGGAESPSDITIGTTSQVAITNCMALTGGATYILPGSGGSEGRQEEIWNLTFGVVFYPGSAMRTAQSQFRPFFTPADNGNFGIWRR